MPRVGRAPKPQPQPDDRQVAEDVDAQALPVPRRHWTQLAHDEAMRAYGPEILNRLAEGESLTCICKFEARLDPVTESVHLVMRLPGSFPGRSTVYDWCDYDSDFAGRFARARVMGDEALEDEALAIAEDNSQDWVATERGMRLNVEHIQRAKLRIETRFQLIDRRKNGRPGSDAAAKGKPKATPTRILVVGIEPKGMAGPSRDIEGQAVRVDQDDEFEPI